MKSLFTILLLGLFIASKAQNISQSQVRQFNAVPAYRVFGRGAGVGTPSFITLDSNHVPQLHSQGYYDFRYRNNTISTYDFIIGDGGTNTPIAGTTVYTNTALKGKAITSFKQAGIQLPLTPISGSAYVTFDSSNGTVTINNSVFSNGSYYSVTTAGVGTFSGTASSSISPYLVYSTLFSGSLAPVSSSALAVTNVRQQLLSTDWNDDVRPAYVRFIGNFGLGINSNDVVELRVTDVTNSIAFSSATTTVPYLFGTSNTNDPNAAAKVTTPWIAIPSSRIYVTFAAYNQTASRGSLTNLRMEVKYQ